MKILPNAKCIWSMKTGREAGVVNQGDGRIPHPLESALEEATIQGYEIKEMDRVRVILQESKERSYEGSAILLYKRDGAQAAIVETASEPGFGRFYHLVEYKED